ncbi:MAG: amidohydrolase family protein [Limisphaerales bacterium]
MSRPAAWALPETPAHREMLLRARVVVPITQPPIENGVVRVTGARIRAVGRWRDLRRDVGEVVDLGDVALLPGLVNAHCHLDYTGMAGLFPPPRRFTDWLKLITATKGQWSDEDFAQSWREGAAMLLRNGVTTVGDVEAVPALLPAAWEATPLRVFSFLEMTGIRSRRQPRQVLEEAMSHIGRLRHRRNRAWLSPHAPYSTLPELVTLAARAARRRRWRITMHVAESDQEFEMFRHAQGEMHEWLARNERDNRDCGLGSPVEHLERCGALHPSLLAIHVNYLAPGDAGRLGRAGVHVVHCPRSHAFFRHQAFPYEALLAAGVNLCLATDSLATVEKPHRQPVELDLFAEMRAFAARFPQVAPEHLIRMVTVNPARALGQAGCLGEIRAGACADLIAIPFRARATAVHEGLLAHTGPVRASLIGGRWALRA